MKIQNRVKRNGMDNWTEWREPYEPIGEHTEAIHHLLVAAGWTKVTLTEDDGEKIQFRRAK